jgi:hypothetical protein
MNAPPQLSCRLRFWRRYALSVCIILILPRLSYPNPAPSSPELTSYDVEAAYLYNFGKFIQWPADSASASQPFSICILGVDNFGRKLDDLIANDTIQGRKIVARHITTPDSIDNCQIVFLGLSEDAHLKKDLDALDKKPILTVSNIPQFLERGGMIQFLVQDRRVRFAVNLPAAERTGLALSSELLKVAVYVNKAATAEAEP